MMTLYLAVALFANEPTLYVPPKIDATVCVQFCGGPTIESQTRAAWGTLQASGMTDTDCYEYDQEIKRINQGA